MRLRTLWTIAGAAWGAVLGVAAGLWVFSLGALYLWVRQIEPNSWFDPVGLAILAIAIGVGSALFLVCAALGYWIGGLARGEPHGEPDRGPHKWRRRYWMRLAGYAAIAAAILTPTIEFVLVNEARKASIRQNAEAREQRRATDDTHTARLDEFMATRHRVTGVVIDWPGDGGDFAATIDIEGKRAGAYEMTWRVRDGIFNRALVGETQTLALDTGGLRMQIDFSAATMVQNYRDELLNEIAGRPGVGTGIDENFRLETVLTPLLGEAELATLPDFVGPSLARGSSPLIDISVHEFPVRFVLRDGRISWE